MQFKYPLLLIRHGQAEHHTQDITGGWTDTSLTETGIQQAYFISERLHSELDGTPVYLATSNLRRALQTAEIIGKALKIPFNIHASITDLNNGVAAGKTHDEARAHAIPPSEPIIDWAPYPDAESWRQFHQRVSAFMDEFVARQTCTAILVTHQATIHAIIAWWLGLPADSPAHFDNAPGSLTVLKPTRDGDRALVRMNDTAHLYVQGMRDPIYD